MIRQLTISLLFFSFSTISFEKDITKAFGIEIGGAISDQHLGDQNNQYPTRLISVEVPIGHELIMFDSLKVQLIESSKKVYSIIAEKESLKCGEEFKELFEFFEKRYENLKVLREIDIDGRVISTFDGYLSSDGKRKLSINCSTAEGSNSEMLGISIWHNELAEQASSLWKKFGS